jgi:hypothetical protein
VNLPLKSGCKVEIKSCAGKTELPQFGGFKKHYFDYAIFVVLDELKLKPLKCYREKAR